MDDPRVEAVCAEMYDTWNDSERARVAGILAAADKVDPYRTMGNLLVIADSRLDEARTISRQVAGALRDLIEALSVAAIRNGNRLELGDYTLDVEEAETALATYDRSEVL